MKQVITILILFVLLSFLVSCDRPLYLNSYDPDWEMDAGDWAPTNLTAMVIGDDAICLNWEHNCSFEAVYKIERSCNGRAFVPYAETAADILSYLDTLCDMNVDYGYRVRAVAYNNQESICSITANAILIKDELVLVMGGTFSMGSTGSYSDERPIHSVTLGNYYIGKYEVTYSEYIEFLNDIGASSSGSLDGVELIDMDDGGCALEYYGFDFYFSNNTIADNEDSPVMEISWYGAINYCNWLSNKRGLNSVYTISGTSISADISQNGYRLPTEAEWEYAARGGASSQGYTYSGSNTLGDVAWYYDNSCSAGGNDPNFGVHPVGVKQANELQVFDMSGNVFEWCWDWYNSSYYDNGSSMNPEGPSSGYYRVVRGGGWSNTEDECRNSCRVFTDPGSSYDNCGFRLVRTAK